MSHEKRTGLKRYRSEKGKMILQVQYEYLHTGWNAGSVDSAWRTAWRDAKIEDLTEGQCLVVKPTGEEKA